MSTLKCFNTIECLMQITKTLNSLCKTIPHSYTTVEFACDDDIKDLCFYRLQIVGEYINKILKKEPDILLKQKDRKYWGQIVGLRNRLSHCYGEIDPYDIWEIMHEDLPVLRRNINLIIFNIAKFDFSVEDLESQQKDLMFSFFNLKKEISLKCYVHDNKETLKGIKR